MSYEIKYRSKWTGETQTHRYQGSEAGAIDWAKSLAKDHGCKAVAEHVADGPYDRSGRRRHVISVGDDG